MRDKDKDFSADEAPNEGRYANYFKVGHNRVEFVLDFGQHYDEKGTPQFHTRIIMSPVYVKALMETLRQAMEQHEQGEV
jgi:hypothetical protein